MLTVKRLAQNIILCPMVPMGITAVGLTDGFVQGKGRLVGWGSLAMCFEPFALLVETESATSNILCEY